MGGLRKFVDKIKPTFSEGGKLSFLASTFDAFETFLFVPNTTTSRGAHIRDCNDMKRTMIVVVVALMPALLFGMYNTGYQVGMTGWAAFWFGFLKVLPMIVFPMWSVWASSSFSPKSADTKSMKVSSCRVC